MNIKNPVFIYSVDLYGTKSQIKNYKKSLSNRSYIQSFEDCGQYAEDENFHKIIISSSLSEKELEKKLEKNVCFYGICLFTGDSKKCMFQSTEAYTLQQIINNRTQKIIAGYCLVDKE